MSTTTGASQLITRQTGANAVLRTVESKLSDFISVLDFGAVGDGTTLNDTAFARALAAALYVYVPAGTYAFASALTIQRAGQRLIGANPITTILKFTGATAGIHVYKVGEAMNFNAIENLQILSANAGGTSGIFIEGDVSGPTVYPASFTTIRNNYITTSRPSGKWATGIRLLVSQGSLIQSNRIYDNIDVGITIQGSGGNSSTFVNLNGNTIGAINAGTGLDLQFAQAITSTGDYFQGTGMNQYISIDVSSDLTIEGSDIDNPLGAATYGITCEGILKINSLRGTSGAPGTAVYTNFIRAHNGQFSGSKIFFNGTCSEAVVKMTTANPGGFLDSSYLVNQHATGAAVAIGFGTNNTVTSTYGSVVGGDCVNIQSASTGVVVMGCELHSTTGKCVSIGNIAATLSVIGCSLYASSLANVFGNFDYGAPPVLSGAGNLYNGATPLLNATSLGTAVASASTVVPTGAVFHMTGTTTVNVMTPPYAGYSGLVTVISDAAWAWATGGGAGGFASAGTAKANRAYTFFYDGTFAKRLWYLVGDAP